MPKPTLLSESFRALILNRIDQVKADSERKWGKMNAHQMIVHCTDQFRMAYRSLETKPRGNFLDRTLLKWLVLHVVKAPEGKVKTAPELDQMTAGTSPEEFSADVKTLRKMIEDFPAYQGEWGVHPTFGPLNEKEWGRMCADHLDHHLRQFGV